MNAPDGGFLLPPGSETIVLDIAVLGVLAGEFGWLSLYAVTKRLRPGQQNGEQVEASLKRLVKADKVLITERFGRDDLFRFPPRPGEEPTAVPISDPVPKVIRYLGSSDEEIPPPRIGGRRFTPLPASMPALPSPPETTMRITKDQVLEQLAKGARTTAQISAALKCQPGAANYHLTQLLADKKVHKPEGRMGPWALANGYSLEPAPQRTRPPHDVAELRWSVSSDGSVLFRVADTSIDVGGEVLERVIRAREAVLAA